ncbi:MAG: YybH family protein [Gemmatimonadaceae bacterium]
MGYRAVGVPFACSAAVELPIRAGSGEAIVTDAPIRQRVENWAKAVRGKDIDRVMSFYAADIVSFDIDGPLRYAGAGNKRQAWDRVFAAYRGPIGYEVQELSVAMDGDLAVTHGVNHVSGTLANGHATSLWVRGTMCFRRIDGVWLITHDHVSVPSDLEHGQALLNLTP